MPASTSNTRTAAPLNPEPARRSCSASKMPRTRLPRRESDVRLYVEPMDAVVVDVNDAGGVQIENEDWTAPTLQERRAFIFAARNEIAALTDLVDILERTSTSQPR